MVSRKDIRQIQPYKDYFIKFKKELSKSTLAKIYYVFTLIMTFEVISAKYLKAIKGGDGLYEIRIEDGGNIYRIFCCFDEDNIVVLFNAFQKKTDKTPSNEIDKAKRIMKEYFELKKKNGYEQRRNEKIAFDSYRGVDRC